VHVIPPEPHRQVITDRVPSEDNLVWEEAHHRMDAFTQDWSAARCPWKSLVNRGDLVDVIPAMIEEQDVDLIVLGTHGRLGVSKLILGSSAEKIYRSAACPVLTVGPGVQKRPEWSLRRILCPVDPAEDPEAVLRYALSLAEESQAELVILEAVPLVPWPHRESVEERSRRAIESLIPESARDWCTFQIVIRWDYPADAFVREAEERQVDLIVMSVHKSRLTSLSAHLPWPVASEVVSRAPCPVLTIRV
jgi:nucleotide-binding universal stress UspA family protein